MKGVIEQLQIAHEELKSGYPVAAGIHIEYALRLLGAGITEYYIPQAMHCEVCEYPVGLRENYSVNAEGLVMCEKCTEEHRIK